MEKCVSGEIEEHYTLHPCGKRGAIQHGVHKVSGRSVAVKMVALGKMAERELELMKSLGRHDHIVEFVDCFRTLTDMMLVMEYLPGGDLLAYCVQHGPLNEDAVRRFFRDIHGGVSYMHSKGIVHRDLKLENCMLTAESRVKMIDFGLGSFWREGEMLCTACGSPSYVAPEILLHQTYLGPPVDVWAMGVMLFCMRSGEFPFESIQCTLDKDYEWPDASDGLKTLVDAMFDLGSADCRCDTSRRVDECEMNFIEECKILKLFS